MKFKARSSVVITFALALFAYNNCGRIQFNNDLAGSLKIQSGETIVGNPMTTAAKSIMFGLCAVVTRCHSEVTESDCENGLAAVGGIDYQLGLAPGSVANYAAIVQAEQAGTLSANAAASASCSAAIARLQCSDSSVQAAYDSARQSLAGLAFMIPTAPGSCPAVFSVPPERKDYYVSTGGSDGNDGSVAKPWATIDHAAQALKPGAAGATVHVASGTYSVTAKAGCGSNGASCGINTARSGQAGAPLVYVSDEQGGAKIVAPSVSATWYNSGDYVQIIGFEIIGTTDSNFGIFSEGAFGQMIGNHIHGIPVANGCATSHAGGGIFFGYVPGAHDNDVIGNLIHDIGPRLANGLSSGSYCQGMALGISYDQPGGKVQNNVVYGVDSWAVSTWHLAKQLQITHNLLFNNGALAADGKTVGGAILISGEAGAGVHDDTTVANNIIRNNSGKGLYELDSVGTRNAYLNNLMFNNGQNFVLNSGNAPVGTLSVDPLMIGFQLAGGGDDRLQANSPAIDAGTANCALATGDGQCTPVSDGKGFSRTYGAASDLGPYEWHP